MRRYQQLAQQLRHRIEQGQYPAGSRLPGVRPLAAELGCSITSLISALRRLEDEALISARHRSGFYVSAPARPLPMPAASNPPQGPQLVQNQQRALQLTQNSQQPGLLPLATAIPAAEFLPLHAVQRALSYAVRHAGKALSQYSFPPGDPNLRHKIAQRMGFAGCELTGADLLITSGCQEALSLALRATCRPGGIVAVESPCFYGLLQIIDSLGLKAIEIPTDPRTGISLAALQLALEQWPIQACALMANFSNPLGYCISDADKQQLVNLLAHFDVPLIENDIYGDLGFGPARPSACKSFDQQGLVIYCNSFAKTLSPALRLGWIAAGRYQSQIEYLKYAQSLASPTLAQIAVSHLLSQGQFDAWLRQVRLSYRQQIDRFRALIGQHFPASTKVSQPQGGFMLWLELPATVDAWQLSQQAMQFGLSLAPGPMFSATGKYRHCIRLNCAQPITTELQQALAALGQAVYQAA